MMAADYRFYDQIVDRGWLPVLTPAAKDLLWAMGRWTDRRPMRTRATPERVGKAAGFAPSTLRRAWAEVLRFGLVTLSMIDGRQYVHVAFPVPSVPSRLLKIEQLHAQNWATRWPELSNPPRRKADQKRISANGPQKTMREDHKRRPGVFWPDSVRHIGKVNGDLPHILTESELLDFDSVVAKGVGPWPS